MRRHISGWFRLQQLLASRGTAGGARASSGQTAPPVLRCDDELAPATRGLARSAGFCPSVWRLTSLARKAHRGVARRRDDPTETRRSDTRRYETSDPIRYETGTLGFCFFARCRNRLYTIRDRKFGFLFFRKVPQAALYPRLGWWAIVSGGHSFFFHRRHCPKSSYFTGMGPVVMW